MLPSSGCARSVTTKFLGARIVIGRCRNAFPNVAQHATARYRSSSSLDLPSDRPTPFAIVPPRKFHRCSFGPHDVRTIVTVTRSSDPPPADSAAAAAAATPSLSSSAVSNSDEAPTLAFTDGCIRRILNLSRTRGLDPGSEIFLRIYVDPGGCSGFTYKFDLEEDTSADGGIDPEEDVVLARPMDGTTVRIVIDSSSMDLLQGSTVDYKEEMIRSAFVIVDNPQSESACGCGSSFAVKNFAANS
mmetsp:Transcript_3774/g.7011  ORF Transcript_3774/g.7011 Transcript_3774/m.7011 type:complete len:244 (-) Transcript_3774:327-1058(-)